MNLIKTLAAGAVALTAMSTASLAADVIYPVVPAPAPVVVPAPVPAPTWTGAYFGITGGVTFSQESEGPWKNLGVIGGYDLQIGSRFVAGVSVRTTTVSPLSAPAFINFLDATLAGRGGVLLANDRLLAYGTAGIGLTTGSTFIPHLTFGAGVEFAITDRIHTFAQFEHARALGGPSIGNTIQLGVTLR
ncbi:MAG: outer membrane protein [Bauldia sp.]